MTGTRNTPEPNVLAGVVPVLPTPFTPDGEIDLESFDRILDHLVNLGVPAVMVPGFASEFYKLDEAEKFLMGTRAIEGTAGTGTASILAVHAHATRHAVREAQCWVEAGADWVNVLPPQFMSPSPESLAEHCAAVLLAVPETPVILQYAPTSGAGITADAVRRLADEHDNLAAVKVEARPPYRFIAELREAAPPIPCFAGSGGLYMLESLRLGAIGVQPGSGFVEVYQAIQRAWDAGEHERAESVFARLLTYLVGWASSQEGMVAVEKRIAQRRGLIDHSTCRAPHHLPHPIEDQSVDRFLAEFADHLEGVS